MNICLDNLTMNCSETDDNGVINEDTIFQFRQDGSHVHATYRGGRIEHGFLVGINTGQTFEFRYCQIETDGTLNGGASQCKLRLNEASLVQIIEEFEWETRPGGGRNVIQEIPTGISQKTNA